MRFDKILTFLFFLGLGATTLPGQSIAAYPNVVYRGTTVNFLVTGINTPFSQATGCRVFRLPSQWITDNYVDPNPTIHSNTSMNAEITIPLSAPAANDYVLMAEGFGWDYSSPIQVLDPPAGKGRITGKVYRNAAMPCFTGSSSHNQLIRILPGPLYAVTDVNGEYEIWLPTGVYSVELMNPPVNHSVLCPVTPYTNVAIGSPGQVVPFINFHLDQQPVVDVAAEVFTNAHRPGFSTTNYVKVDNLGANPANNVEVKVFVDPMETLNSTTPTGTFQSDTITWNIGTLQGNANSILYFNVTTPVNTLGGNIRYSVTATTTSSDVNLANNFHDITTGITGSFDPNDKQVWTQDDVNADGPINPTDSLLRYLVRFQNTGTDTAFNIRITDELDTDLDWSTLKILSSSHNQYFTLDSTGFLTFFFPNVLLVDSNRNETLSHGHIEYSIQPLPGLSAGTSIDNEANIYFDFNSPVLTNTVSSTVCDEASLDFSYLIAGPDVTFSNLSTGTLGSFEWDFGDGNTSVAATPIHPYTAVGIYEVCLNMTDTCGTRSVCQEVEITTITEISGQEEWESNFTLFPNPNAGLFNLRGEWPRAGHLRWRVLDLRGKILHQADEGKVSGVWQKQVDLRDLPVGSYFLQVEINDRQINRMFHLR